MPKLVFKFYVMDPWSCLFQDEARQIEYEQLIFDQRCWTKDESPTINLVNIKLFFNIQSPTINLFED